MSACACIDQSQSARTRRRHIDALSGEINHRYDPLFDSIRHIDRKWRNNLIESNHAALKRLLGYRQSFRSRRTAEATLSGIETIRTIKRGHIHHKNPAYAAKSRSLPSCSKPPRDIPLRPTSASS
ncbi:transposase [Roseovarius sp. M141]|uniref:transposase n=1 Tax=Roseovarius sp. M141 TaxID=2583806 RepID=UPI0020CC0B9B|nr:transposase [Roseovarius sp. M141]